MVGEGIEKTSDWIRLCSVNDPVKGEIIVSALEEEGILSFIADRMDSAYTFMSEIDIYVPRARQEDAIETYKKIAI